MSWYHRARVETFRATRTWFGTLTFNPQRSFECDLRTRQRLYRSGVDFKELPPEIAFLERSRETGEDITKWLKRLRKETAAPFRYLLALEAHKSGLPHYHILLHEVSATQRISERQLSGQWNHGFTKFRLADDKRHIGYVTKYIAKDCKARVRASGRYGQFFDTVDQKTDPSVCIESRVTTERDSQTTTPNEPHCEVGALSVSLARTYGDWD